MYEEVMKIVDAGSYELVDLLHRIDVLYADAKLSDDEREQLVGAAREHANPEASMAPVMQRVEALEVSVRALESRIAALEGGEGGDEPEPTEEYPDYVQPTGAHDAYNTGDKITWDGKRYTCTMDGCVWNPDAYPAAWEYVGYAPSDEMDVDKQD